MNSLEGFVFEHGFRCVCNVIIGVSIVSAGSLMGLIFLRNCPAEFRQRFLIGGLFGILFSPIFTLIWWQLDFGMIGNQPVPPESTADIAFNSVSIWSKILIQLALACWAAGILVVAIRVCVGYLTLYRMRVEPLDSELLTRVEQLSDRLGLTCLPRIFESSSLTVPISYGVVRSKIVVPKDFAQRNDDCDIESIFVHELEHVRQRHHLIRLIQVVLTTLFWWHPLVRILDSELRATQEEVCDNAVLQQDFCGENYARCLLLHAELSLAKRSHIACSFSFCKSELERRVQNILTRSEDSHKRVTIAGVVGLLVLVVLVCGVHACANFVERQNQKVVDTSHSPRMWGEQPLIWGEQPRMWGGVR